VVENNSFMHDIQRIQSEQIGRKIAPATKQAEGDFKSEFEKKLAAISGGDSVKFSSHAIQRLQKRNIEVTAEDIGKINSAVAKAEQKGALESLVLVDDLALIVSIKNKTVITAMDKASMKEQVVTNIDSAVIA
jgi:flagellar operon protein